MKILYGLLSGAVLQRQENDTCRATLGLEAEGTVCAAPGTLTELAPEDGVRRFSLTGIPVGGPYEVTLRDHSGELTVTDIYVGDVWVLAGQSNMDGAGYVCECEEEYAADLAAGIENLRSLRMDDRWQVAQPCLHQTWMSPDPYFHEFYENNHLVPPPPDAPQTRGVGPGYYFMKNMRRRTGVPQGVLPCALGGSAMFMWDPAVRTLDGANLYSAMRRRVRLAGGGARGMFWYQGCSETSPEGIATFTQNMVNFCKAFRDDFGVPDMPFVQVQILRYTVPNDPETDDRWSQIRELQRRLSEHVPHMDTLAVTSCELADCIHLETTSHRGLGVWAAESMYRLCFDPEGRETLPAPVLESVRATSPSTVEVRFGNLHGGLCAEGLPTGFAFTTQPGRLTERRIIRTRLKGDTAVISHEIPAESMEKLYLYYNFGNDTYCNLTDAAGRPVPAFGPVKVEAQEKTI